MGRHGILVGPEVHLGEENDELGVMNRPDPVARPHKEG